jgi:hypothetical protein
LLPPSLPSISWFRSIIHDTIGVSLILFFFLLLFSLSFSLYYFFLPLFKYCKSIEKYFPNGLADTAPARAMEFRWRYKRRNTHNTYINCVLDCSTRKKENI